MNYSSSLYWLPRIENLAGVKVPQTFTIPYDHRAYADLVEDQEPYPDAKRVLDDVTDAILDIEPPVFVRTDLASAKHDGPGSYRLDRADPLFVTPLLARVVIDNEMKFWLEPDGQPQAFLVREWLDLFHTFGAFGTPESKHPIAREWRYFANADGVLCAHFYWPAASIEDHEPDQPDWRTRLAVLEVEPPPNYVDDLAVAAAAACATPEVESWSVDFAQTVDGEWWLIDMAVGDRSWHPNHEEN